MSRNNERSKEHSVRLNKAIFEQLKTHRVAAVYDGMGRSGATHYEMKPLRSGMRLCGPAWTIKCTPGDLSVCLKAVRGISPNYVVVIDVDGVKDLATVGIELVTLLQSLNVDGIVIDGAIRDSDAIVKTGLPVFCRGITPKALVSPAGEFDTNIPVDCAGVLVNPEDLILGDDDGVVVIPREDVTRILDYCEADREREQKNLVLMEQGVSIVKRQNCLDKVDRLLGKV